MEVLFILYLPSFYKIYDFSKSKKIFPTILQFKNITISVLHYSNGTVAKVFPLESH